MSTAFSDVEVQFLTSGVKALARIATVGKDGLPHVVPSGWTYNAELDTLDVTGRDVELTKKYRDVLRNRRAAVVIDGVDNRAGWSPWGG